MAQPAGFLCYCSMILRLPVLGPIDPVTGRPLYLPHDVVSGTEATGLEPIPPRTPEEAESYAELYDWPLADQPPRR